LPRVGYYSTRTEKKKGELYDEEGGGKKGEGARKIAGKILEGEEGPWQGKRRKRVNFYENKKRVL